MKMSLKSRGMILVFIAFSILPTCATTMKKEDHSTGFLVKKLEIPPSVSTTASYTATMHRIGLENVEVMMGYFYWDKEGPSEYTPTGVDLETEHITFNLRTRNPGTYVVRGYVSYKDKATGEIGMSNTVSAGALSAR